MYKQWTRDDIKDSLERISRLYVKTPISQRVGSVPSGSIQWMGS